MANRKVKTIKDVVDWGLCIGCGACFYICPNNAITLKNFDDSGIRPVVDANQCNSICECLSVCPGVKISNHNHNSKREDITREVVAFGPTVEIWEGYATDAAIRLAASSGGIITALALYCLEQENMEFVLHTGMNAERPWLNQTVISKTKDELLAHAGSRYAPSSPCDSLSLIEKSDRPVVFIGKPCDTLALNHIMLLKPELKSKIGVIITFFCAGVPSTQATLDLIDGFHLPHHEINEIRYRGQGWPGYFSIYYDNRKQSKYISYKDSWHRLQKHRSFRCHICADGLGQIADLSCGDAWHRFLDNGNPGQSVILVRTEHGQHLLHKAIAAGYISATASNSEAVFQAQGLLKRKPHVFGRLLAMRLLSMPIPAYDNFHLFSSWQTLSLHEKLTSVFGTIRRLIRKKLYKPHPLT